jgi:hypothetical protein
MQNTLTFPHENIYTMVCSFFKSSKKTMAKLHYFFLPLFLSSPVTMPLSTMSLSTNTFTKKPKKVDLIIPSKAKEFKQKRTFISMNRRLRFQISRRSIRKGK